MYHWFYTYGDSRNKALCEQYVQTTVHYLKVSVILTVAAVPEGFLAVVIVWLDLCARRMAYCSPFSRDLPSVEIMGRCTIICFGKTSILTTSCVFVVDVVTLRVQSEELSVYDLEDSKYEIILNSVTRSGAQVINPLACNADLDMLCTVAVFCNESNLYRTVVLFTD
ncbi:unnamed protein product [Phytomonas sp. EM1]|nr:unnamed protein product [Phytomonas sp. EM1]|eukprot:CCW65826.1 unnamed protein product [Phytomonas sp. isolate EM1]